MLVTCVFSWISLLIVKGKWGSWVGQFSESQRLLQSLKSGSDPWKHGRGIIWGKASSLGQTVMHFTSCGGRNYASFPTSSANTRGKASKVTGIKTETRSEELMGHCVDQSKVVQSIKPELTKRFQSVFLLWSLLFPAALLALSVHIYSFMQIYPQGFWTRKM